MILAWAIGALVIFVASFVMGLTGFGIALVAMAFLPWVMSPVTAVVVLTIYAIVFSVVVVVPLRREADSRALVDLLIGSAIGTPLGVWVLATLPITALNRLIGAVLIVVRRARALEGVAHAAGRPGLGPRRRVPFGLVGGAVGTPGPPIIIYATTQGGARAPSRRT